MILFIIFDFANSLELPPGTGGGCGGRLPFGSWD